MPFVAETALGTEVLPGQVDGDATLTCPECDEDLLVKQSHEREGSFVARHFYHPSGSDCDGPGGESVEHARRKAIAYSKLDDVHPEATLHLEFNIGDRFADVACVFPDPVFPYGNGIVCEVQYRNEGKDIEGATEEYLAHGYSVFWLFDEHFDGADVDLDQIIPVWPAAVPTREEWTGTREVDADAVGDAQEPRSMPIALPISYFTQASVKRSLRASWASGYIEQRRAELRSKNGDTHSDDSGWSEIAAASLTGGDHTEASIELLRTPDRNTVLALKKSYRGNEQSVYIQVQHGIGTALRDLVVNAVAQLSGDPDEFAFEDSSFVRVWEQQVSKGRTAAWVWVSQTDTGGVTISARKIQERETKDFVTLGVAEDDVDALTEMAAQSLLSY